MKHFALLLAAASSTAGLIRSAALGVLLLLGLVAPSQAQCNPTIVGQLPLGQTKGDMKVAGNLVYVTTRGAPGMLHVINVANPASPQLLSSMNTGGDASGGLAVSGNYAYIANWGSLAVANITNPQAPQIVGLLNYTPTTSTTGGQYTGIGYENGTVYLAVRGHGLYPPWQLDEVSVVNPATPVRIRLTSLQYLTYSLIVSNGKMYAGNNYGFGVYALSSSGPPTFLYQTPGYNWWGLGAVFGTTLYASGGSAQIVYDVSNPTSLVYRGTIAGGGQNRPGVGPNGLLYFTDHFSVPAQAGFRVVDVSNPNGPYPIRGNISGAYFSHHEAATTGSYCYAVDSTRFVVIGTSGCAACTAPSITASPASLEVCYGSSRTLNATATGTAPLSFQWRFNGTNIAGATASSLALTNVDFSYAGSYTCTVTNACGTATTAAATIAVHPAGPDIETQPLAQTLCLGATASFTVAAHAHMQGVLQYQWLKDGLPIAGAPATATLSFPVTGLGDGGNYVCRVTEPNCGHSDSDAALLTVNRAPSVDAGGNFNVNEAQLGVSLQGSASDPEDGTLTYAWTQLPGGTQVSLNGANTLSPTFDAPIVALGGETLTFQLTVTDACQSSDATVSVSVVNINHPPVAEAGVDQSVAEGAPVALDGAASFDIDGDDFSRSWVQVSGPTVTLSDASAANPTFTAPVINGSGAPGVVATLVFSLTVDDTYTPDAPAPGYSLSDVEDLVTIEVTNINNLPVAAAGVDQTVAENAAVTLTGAGSSDPDGDTLTYAWVQVGTPTVTLSDPTAAAPTFTAPFVSAGGADLTFQLTVDDGYFGTAIDTIVVHVQNANDPPLASAARPSQALLWPPNHGMVAISILGVTDPNNNATITITGVWQDEATSGLGDGDTPIDAILNPDGTVLIRAERAGNGNGRVYHIHFTASDLEGSSSGVVKVSVPRDKKSVAVDGGALHVSTN